MFEFPHIQSGDSAYCMLSRALDIAPFLHSNCAPMMRMHRLLTAPLVLIALSAPVSASAQIYYMNYASGLYNSPYITTNWQMPSSAHQFMHGMYQTPQPYQTYAQNYQPYQQPSYQPTYQPQYQQMNYPEAHQQPTYNSGYSTGNGLFAQYPRYPGSYGTPTGDTIPYVNEPLCYYPDYGRASCYTDPRQRIYDYWTGTWY